MERIKDAWAIFFTPVWLQPLSFTEFLNIGAEVYTCLSAESTPFGKKQNAVSSWLAMAMSLAQKA